MPPQRWLAAPALHAAASLPDFHESRARAEPNRPLGAVERAAAGVLATQAYYDELLRARADHE